MLIHFNFILYIFSAIVDPVSNNTTHDPKPNSSGNVVLIIAVVAVVLVIVLAVALVSVLCYRKRKLRASNNDVNTDASVQSMHTNVETKQVENLSGNVKEVSNEAYGLGLNLESPDYEGIGKDL